MSSILVEVRRSITSRYLSSQGETHSKDALCSIDIELLMISNNLGSICSQKLQAVRNCFLKSFPGLETM